MESWKRNALIAYIVCSLLVLVMFLCIVLAGGSVGFVSALHGLPFFQVLLTLVCLVVFAGLCYATYLVVNAFVHAKATLHTDQAGVINIEKSALVSTARRALDPVEGVTVVSVLADVVQKKGVPVIDVTVTAVPYGADSLMACASHIQSVVKTALEAFTDHEVRYVAVNFVEPRRRSDVKAARSSLDARIAAAQAASSAVASDDASGQGEAPCEQPAKPSLWERAKAKAASLYTQKDEDVLETQAVVEPVEVDVETGSGKEPSGTDAAAADEGDYDFVMYSAHFDTEAGEDAPDAADGKAKERPLD